MRVLVADDDPIYLTLVTRQVLNWTEDVLSAASGADACRLLLQDPTIELAILDRVMPGMDAIEVCKQVRATRGPLPYIIIITAHDSNGDILEALENGADDYIRKPFLPAELKARADVGRRTSKLQRELLQQCQASQQKEAEMRSLLQSTSEGICGVDRRGRCTSINRAAAAILGYSETELLGKKLHDLVHHHRGDGTPYPADECPIVRTARTGTSEQKAEELLWKRDGTSFRSRYSVNPIVTEDGAITGAVMAFSDITEELRLRERMQQSAKLEAVGRLAGGVAHDFNNLLMAITAHTELLQTRFSPKSANIDSCTQILAACSRGASLTSRLLGFGRKQMARRTILDLNKAVAEELEILSRVIGEDIRVELKLDDGRMGIAIDPNQLSQVLFNLVINARDAMPRGGKLAVATSMLKCRNSSAPRNWMAPGEYVTLSLTDSGDGIPEGIREHIFEPFFTTKGPKGSGLGLASVYGIVKQSGGYIDFETSTSGTTFTMYFPARQLACTTTAVDCVETTSPEKIVSVLLVEDEQAVRDAVTVYLKNNGFQVLSMGTVGEAISAVDEGYHPAVLVTDVVLPESDGVALSKLMRTRMPQLKTILVSGYSGNVIKGCGVMESGTKLLQKPFSLHSLMHAIKEIAVGKECDRAAALKIATARVECFAVPLSESWITSSDWTNGEKSHE